MIIRICFFCLTFIFVQANNAQELEVSKIVSNNFYDVSFSDTLNGWAVGQGVVLHTTDGGNIWERNNFFSPTFLYESVSNTITEVAWIGAVTLYPSSSLFRTTDTGITWDTVLYIGGVAIDQNHYSLVKAFDSLHVWVVEDVGFTCECSASILQTTNGGSDWGKKIIDYFQYDNQQVNGISLYSDSIAMLITHGKSILTTINAGDTWLKNAFSIGSSSLKAISMASSNYAWVVGDDGLIFKTTNQGDSWFQQHYDTSLTLLSVSAIDTSNVWAVGQCGNILRTTNGGDSWDSVLVATKANLNAVYFVDKNHGWAVGDSGVILNYDNGKINNINNSPIQITAPLLLQNYPNPFNPITKIKFQISRSNHVSLKVNDILGREVATLVDEELKPGNYEKIFDGTRVVSGVYFYQLKSGSYIGTKKLILIK
jgi:photosystem II stability/assembly factor-like uncharacterized protein